MKKSEMVIKLARMYGIRHVMVEGGYITPMEFMSEVLGYVQALGMMPPKDGSYPYSTHDWEPEVKEENL